MASGKCAYPSYSDATHTVPCSAVHTFALGTLVAPLALWALRSRHTHSHWACDAPGPRQAHGVCALHMHMGACMGCDCFRRPRSSPRPEPESPIANPFRPMKSHSSREIYYVIEGPRPNGLRY